MKLAKNQAGDDERLRRPEPPRTGPYRSAAAGEDPPSSGSETPPPGEAAQKESEVQRIIADAVQLGYDVIGKNLEHGRAAADHFSSGTYGVQHVQDDVGALGGRLVQLAQDLSKVWFDLMGAVLRDPALQEALKPRPKPEPKPGPDDPKPGGDPPAKDPAKVQCDIKGNDKASAEPFYLSQPETPARLAVAGLHAHLGAPPITNVMFLATGDGTGIVATITVPKDQPAGVYHGVVCDEKTHSPLGTLTVRVQE